MSFGAFFKPYTLTRSTKSTYVNGRVQPGTPLTTTVMAQVTPVEGEQLERLAEGMGTRELLEVFTEERLYVASDETDPDVLTVNNAQYEVQQVSPWSALGQEFFHSIMTKVG